MKKLGTVEWYMPIQGPAAVRLGKTLGLDGLQITDLGGAARNYPLLDPRIQDMYREEIEGSDFKLYTLHPLHIARKAGIQRPMDSAIGEETLEIFKMSIESCKALDIPTIMLASFAESKFRNSYEYKNTIETLKYYKKYAEDNGVRLIYEGFSGTETMLDICEKVQGLTICYDIANPLMFGFSTPEKDITEFDVAMIDCVHVKDAREDMTITCPIGYGVANVKESLKALREKGFEGWYFTETHYNEFINKNRNYAIDLLLKDSEFTRKNW